MLLERQVMAQTERRRESGNCTAEPQKPRSFCMRVKGDGLLGGQVKGEHPHLTSVRLTGNSDGKEDRIQRRAEIQ